MSASTKVGSPCPVCPSRDAYGVDDNGWGHCFSCGVNIAPDGSQRKSKKGKSRVAGKLIPIDDVEPRGLKVRKLTQQTCERYRYGFATVRGKQCQVAPYFDDRGRLVAQKLRYPGKKFEVRGDINKATLFGQKLFSPGRQIVITEGELDAMAVSQALSHKSVWGAVSVPQGAPSAVKYIRKQIEWLEQFETVVLCFDNDEPGQDAVEDIVRLFSPGKVKIAELPLKDASDMVKDGRSDELRQAIWNAREWRPDGVVSLADVREQVLRPVEDGLPWPWDSLTRATYGRRRGELYGFGGGTGAGKTDVFTQVVDQTVFQLELPVGLIYLEQPPVETIRRVAGKHAGKRFHVPDEEWTVEELEGAIEELDQAGKIYLYDHFGSMDWETVESRIRYMAVGLGVKDIFLDHLTALAAHAEDERKELEMLMAELAAICQELRITIYFVSHLATPDGKPHEEGGRVMVRHFKGSRAIGYWSHFLFGLERDQQASDEEERHTTTFRILKDRYTGQATGQTFQLGYDAKTGMLEEVDRNFDEDDDGFDDSEDLDDDDDEAA